MPMNNNTVGQREEKVESAEVVYVYPDGETFELELFNFYGETLGVETAVLSRASSLPAECKHPERPDYSDLIEKVEGMKKSVFELFPGTVWAPTEENFIKARVKDGYNQALSDVAHLLKQEGGKK